MDFDDEKEPNPDYFEEKGGKYYLKKGSVADAAHDRVYDLTGQGATGCERAAQTLALEGLAQVAKKLGKEDALDRACAGKTMDELFPRKKDSPYQKFHKDDNGLDPRTFLPGDRVWMDNHRFVKKVDEDGNEGSNVIYLGKSKRGGEPFFMHTTRCNHMVENMEQLRKTVRGYSPSNPDPNILNYKIKRRYSPTIPDSLKP